MAILLVSTLIFTSVSLPNVLSKFDSEFQQMMHHMKRGDTSRSFSIAMKMLVAVETLKGDLDIEEPIVIETSDEN